jgi:hypothetical protein
LSPTENLPRGEATNKSFRPAFFKRLVGYGQSPMLLQRVFLGKFETFFTIEKKVSISFNPKYLLLRQLCLYCSNSNNTNDILSEATS